MLGALDVYLFHEGTHRRLWEIFGAHVCCVEGVWGTRFTVWAPHAVKVAVVGDFCAWDGQKNPMSQEGHPGIFTCFVPGVQEGDLYKFHIHTQEGRVLEKADPYARYAEIPPRTASVVAHSAYVWGDHAWMDARKNKKWRQEPLCVYELHLDSWFASPYLLNQKQHYREVVYRIVDHVKACGFNAVELMPVMEHPFNGSWGYQVCGYYAPTSRYGSADDMRFLVDVLHQHHIAVILDWVPAHFPKDAHGLAGFDGECLYEYADKNMGEHADWGTLVFNYASHEVRNFLCCNALYWCDQFHVDGLRVDAVASMLYRDYSKKEGAWTPNQYGGREHLEAVSFLQTMNQWLQEECEGVFTVAEESTSWPGVTKPVQEGGLGFTFKWNMGWMHDTLEYFKRDAVHRKYHQNQLTFAMVYEYSEHFMMPLSHDEVVHGKKSLYSKMPGDPWQKRANTRLLLAYQYTRPGKKLVFMGCEILDPNEWDYNTQYTPALMQQPHAQEMMRCMGDLGRMYQREKSLWAWDSDPKGFAWIDYHDAEQSVMAFVRRHEKDFCVVVAHMTPLVREGYRVGVPEEGVYRMLLNTDSPSYGGSGCVQVEAYHSEPVPMHGYACSVVLTLPPLGLLVLKKHHG
jgi:1,4-alpha-glucan branching enzyme